MKLVIPSEIWAELMFIVKGVGTWEVGGLAVVELEKSEDEVNFLVKELLLSKQSVGSASFEMDSADLARTLVELEEDKVAKVRLWWHSHASMAASWSGVDDETSQKLARCVDGWFLGLVVNNRGDKLARLDVYVEVPGLEGVKIHYEESLEVQIGYPLNKERKKELEKFISLVKESVTVGRVKVYPGRSAYPIEDKQSKSATSLSVPQSQSSLFQKSFRDIKCCGSCREFSMELIGSEEGYCRWTGLITHPYQEACGAYVKSESFDEDEKV